MATTSLKIQNTRVLTLENILPVTELMDKRTCSEWQAFNTRAHSDPNTNNNQGIKKILRHLTEDLVCVKAALTQQLQKTAVLHINEATHYCGMKPVYIPWTSHFFSRKKILQGMQNFPEPDSSMDDSYISVPHKSSADEVRQNSSSLQANSGTTLIWLGSICPVIIWDQ